MSSKGPTLPDLQTLIQAGIDPKTKLPIRFKDDSFTNVEEFTKFLRIIDEQDAINRFNWFGIPCDISSQELERLLYLKYNLAFFYVKELEEFYFMPFALDGSLDFYGRANYIHPIPIVGGADEDENYKTQAEVLSKMRFKVIYSPIVDEEISLEEAAGLAVILRDYTPGLNTISGIPRHIINDPILRVEADCIPFMRTALIASTGVIGMRVQDADQKYEVTESAKSMYASARNGIPWIPIIADLDFQELSGGQVAKAEEFMLAMQSIDNLRLRGLGIENGGVFEKKAHMLQDESSLNTVASSSIYQDSLSQRQTFCNIVNSIWGLGIWCEPSESQIGDMNMDGMNMDEDIDSSGVDTESLGE